jgi:hypothetical protein
MAAGYAPHYRETPLGTAEMAPVRQALDRLLEGQEPFPSIVVDRHWNLVASNRPAVSIMTEGVSHELLEPPVNAIRVTFHPNGMASRIVNLAEYSAHFLEQLHRQATYSDDADLFALEEEMRTYSGVFADRPPSEMTSLFVPLVLRAGGYELSFFNTLTTFGTALDITIAELTIESLFPADEATARAIHERWRSTGASPAETTH